MERILKYFTALTPLQKERLAALGPLYEDWNSKINVISRKDMDAFYEHHVLHSLAIAKACGSAFASGESILDLGTGGGFPGIPLAILYPECNFTLCDSIGKKVRVARAVADALKLENVQVVNARAEALESRFDWVVTRAVATLDRLLPWVRGRYSKGVICLKGGDVASEIQAAAGRHLLQPKKVTVSEISIFFGEEWFQDKKVVMVGE